MFYNRSILNRGFSSTGYSFEGGLIKHFCALIGAILYLVTMLLFALLPIVLCGIFLYYYG